MTIQRLCLICGSLFFVCFAELAVANGQLTGTNTGPGTQTTPGGINNPRPIDILGNPAPPPVVVPPVVAPTPTPTPVKLDSNSTRVWIRRGQAREYLAAGRVVTSRICGANGALEQINYRNYVRVHASVGNGNDDNDLLQVELGPEQNWTFTPPVVLNANSAVRNLERASLLGGIAQWNQQIDLANQHIVSNREAYQQTTDPKLQATYASAYQQWSAELTKLQAELLNLQFQLCVRQE